MGKRGKTWKYRRLTESCVELVQAEVSIIVVVIVPQQVLHGALQQAVLQVLFHGDLQHINAHTQCFQSHRRILADIFHGKVSDMFNRIEVSYFMSMNSCY